MKLKSLLPVLVLCLILSLGSSVASAQILSPAETHQLVDMLNTAGFDSTDVNFLKDWDPTTKFKLSCQVDALNNPWKFLKLLENLKGSCSRISKEGSYIAEEMDNYYDTYYNLNFPYHLGEVQYVDYQMPRNLGRFFVALEKDIDRMCKGRQKFFSALTSAQQDSLFNWVYHAWQENEDSLAYKQFYSARFHQAKSVLSNERAIQLLEILYPESYEYYASNLEMFADNCYLALFSMKLNNKKPIYHTTKWGTIIIGTKGDDHYTNDNRLKKNPVCFIYEPGGNDVYDCDIYADNKHPFYIILDLKGNDVYRNPAIAKGMSVLGGYGYTLDYSGNDTYQFGDFSLSALFGSQILVDKSGNDTYSTGLFSQGAAMFGISVLQDNEGNDTYTATEFAQGMGGTKGFGLLLDGKGNDVYYCGGKYLHEPLAPFDYRSMAQGFGFGFRPDLAGGIGVLYDAEGNDRYSGGIYAQGVAYWYAIGALFDEKGNDYYDAVYYPQGSGIHLANGALVDMEGEDHYYSKHGPGQGNGHDWSVGVFVDKKGNDQYSIEGGNGLALTNSVGIFVDSEGDDKYEQKNSSNYGYANAARETGGLGLFLDAGGKDVYPDSAKADNKTWQSGTYGIGRDVELNKVSQTKVEELAEQSVADVDSTLAIDKLFAIASEWEVGSAAERVKLARKYLINRDAEAVPYAIKMKLDTKSGLEYRALEELVKKSDLMLKSLYPVLHDADSLKVKNALSLISIKGDTLAVDSIAVFLNQNKYIPACLSALGNIKTERALQMVLPWTAHHTEKYRYLAARSLKSNGSVAAITELRKLNNDSSFLIKALVRQLPPEKP